MKNLTVLLLSLLFSLPTLSQSPLLIEHFDYQAGDSLQTRGWFSHSAATTNPIRVSSPGLSWTTTPYLGSGVGNAAGVNNTGSDENRPFSSYPDSGDVYISFLIKVSVPTAGFFLHTGEYADRFTPIFTSTSTNFRARTFMNPGSTPDKFRLGLAFNSNSITNTIGVDLTNDLDTAQTYLVVVKYSFVPGPLNDSVSMYVFADGDNIANEPSTPTLGPLAGTASDANMLQYVALRQYNVNQKITVDGLIAQTSWNMVAANATVSLPITWDDPAVNYNFTDFGGTASALAPSPTDPSNTTLRTEKTAGAQTWAGTTLTPPTGLGTAIPFASGATTLSVKVHAPATGIAIRLKAEQATNPTISVETEATTSAAGWQTLVFDFANQATGTAAINFANTYNMLSIFYAFGTTGSGQIFYADSVFFGGSQSTQPSFTNVTFRLDMSGFTGSYGIPEVNGTFNSWCGNCNPMTSPNNDGIWIATIPLPTGIFIEYKYSFDNWTGQETNDPTGFCTNGNQQFTNRVLTIPATDTVLGVVCWGQCTPCAGQSTTSTITFRVDIGSLVPGPGGVRIAGNFQGWNPSGPGNQLISLGGNVYGITLSLNRGDSVQYKFLTDNFWGSDEMVPLYCGFDAGGIINRLLVVPVTNDTLATVPFGGCNIRTGNLTVSGLLHYDNSSQTPLTNTLVELYSLNYFIDAQSTTTSGHYTFSNLAEGEYEVMPVITKTWGGVNATDALNVARRFAGMIAFDTLASLAADVNISGSINSTDALLISRRYVALINSFDAGDWAYVNPSFNLTSSQQLTTPVLCYGDVNRSYLPSTLRLHQSVRLKQDEQLAIVGMQQRYPVLLDKQEKLSAISLKFEIPEGIQVLDVLSRLTGEFLWHVQGRVLAISWFSLNEQLLSKGAEIFSIMVSNDGAINNWELMAEAEMANIWGDIIPDAAIRMPAVRAFAPTEFVAMIYPNPATNEAKMKINLSANALLSYEIYDFTGRLLFRETPKAQHAGAVELPLDLQQFGSGQYFVRIQADIDGRLLHEHLRLQLVK